MTHVDSPNSTIASPLVERVRHELKRRVLTVTAIQRLTPGMLRIRFGGEDLSDFVSLGADDHVKIFIPTASGEIERRDYTPRQYDNASRCLVIDFAVHDAGPATRWALDARVGDTLEIGGPRGSAIISKRVKRFLLIGDETALPAIGRRIEEAGSDHRITSIVAVSDLDDRQTFETAADLTMLWACRPLDQASDPAALLALLKTVELQPETLFWIAAEASVMRALRDYMVNERGHPLEWTKTSGYWAMGKADAHE